MRPSPHEGERPVFAQQAGKTAQEEACDGVPAAHDLTVQSPWVTVASSPDEPGLGVSQKHGAGNVAVVRGGAQPSVCGEVIKLPA